MSVANAPFPFVLDSSRHDDDEATSSSLQLYDLILSRICPCITSSEIVSLLDLKQCVFSSTLVKDLKLRDSDLPDVLAGLHLKSLDDVERIGKDSILTLNYCCAFTAEGAGVGGSPTPTQHPPEGGNSLRHVVLDKSFWSLSPRFRASLLASFNRIETLEVEQSFYECDCSECRLAERVLTLTQSLTFAVDSLNRCLLRAKAVAQRLAESHRGTPDNVPIVEYTVPPQPPQSRRRDSTQDLPSETGGDSAPQSPVVITVSNCQNNGTSSSEYALEDLVLYSPARSEEGAAPSSPSSSSSSSCQSEDEFDGDGQSSRECSEADLQLFRVCENPHDERVLLLQLHEDDSEIEETTINQYRFSETSDRTSTSDDQTNMTSSMNRHLVNVALCLPQHGNLDRQPQGDNAASTAKVPFSSPSCQAGHPHETRLTLGEEKSVSTSFDHSFHKLVLVFGIIFRNRKTLSTIKCNGPPTYNGTGQLPDESLHKFPFPLNPPSEGELTDSSFGARKANRLLFESLRSVEFGYTMDCRYIVPILDYCVFPKCSKLGIGRLTIEYANSIPRFGEYPTVVFAPQHIFLASEVNNAPHLPALFNGPLDTSLRFQGRGYFACEEYVYEGEFQDGVNHGYGIMKSRTGETYQGYWKFGQRNGVGSVIKSSGDILRGVWVNDALDGFGVLETGIGYKYIGNWRASSFEGWGILLYKDILLCYGHFAHGHFSSWSRCVRYLGTGLHVLPLAVKHVSGENKSSTGGSTIERALAWEEATHDEFGRVKKCFQVEVTSSHPNAGSLEMSTEFVGLFGIAGDDQWTSPTTETPDSTPTASSSDHHHHRLNLTSLYSHPIFKQTVEKPDGFFSCLPPPYGPSGGESPVDLQTNNNKMMLDPSSIIPVDAPLRKELTLNEEVLLPQRDPPGTPTHRNSSTAICDSSPPTSAHEQLSAFTDDGSISLEKAAAGAPPLPLSWPLKEDAVTESSKTTSETQSCAVDSSVEQRPSADQEDQQQHEVESAVPSSSEGVIQHVAEDEDTSNVTRTVSARMMSMSEFMRSKSALSQVVDVVDQVKTRHPNNHEEIWRQFKIWDRCYFKLFHLKWMMADASDTTASSSSSATRTFNSPLDVPDPHEIPKWMRAFILDYYN